MAELDSSVETRRLQTFVTIAAVVVAAIGALALAGWIADSGLLKSIAPGLPAMKANTALALIVSAAALLCLRTEAAARTKRIGRILGLAVAAFGLLVCVEHLFGRIGGVDQLLFADHAGLDPGRPSPHAGVTLTILGLALASTDSPRFGGRVNEVLIALAGVMVVFGLVGYLFGVHYLRGVTRANGIALHTLFCLILLVAGTLCLRPDRGLAARLRADDAGARMARVVLPISALAVIFFGAIRLEAEDQGLVGLRLGSAVYALAILFLLTAVVLLMARRLKASESELRTLAKLVESSPDAIVSIDRTGRFQSWNPGAEALLGYTREEALGSPLALVVPDADRRQTEELMAPIWRGQPLAEWEGRRRHKDGRLLDVHLTVAPVRNTAGDVVGVTATLRDITSRKLAERRFESLLEAAPDAMVIVDEAGEIVLVNDRVEEVFGYGRDELLGRPVEALIPERFSSGHPAHRAEFAATPDARPMGAGLELFARNKDGSEFPVEISLSPLETEEGLLVTAAVRDVSARRRTEQALREAEERFRRSFEDSATGMALVEVRSVDREGGRLLQTNQALVELSGYSEAELSGLRIWDLIHHEDLPRVGKDVEDLLARHGATYQTEVRFVGADGRERWASASVSIVRDHHGEPLHAVVQVQDATERKRHEGQLRYLADHDPLTGLANRRRFETELRRELAAAHRYGSGGAVILLDLDNFKALNDSHGHAAGDELLRAVAQAIRGRMRASDTLARLGGDEFAVVIPRASAEEARHAAEGIRRVISEVRLDGAASAHQVTVSTGIAMFHDGPEAALDADLIVEADMAMYEAKKSGRDRIAMYDRVPQPVGDRNSLPE